MIEPALYSLVTGDAGVSALIATRMYPALMPQNVTLPAVSYSVVVAPGDHHGTAASGYVSAIYRIDCWATTFAAARELAQAVREAIDGYRGTVTPAGSPLVEVTIGAILLESERDLYEDESRVYRRSQTYRVNYRR